MTRLHSYQAALEKTASTYHATFDEAWYSSEAILYLTTARFTKA
jgi:hypothetical protein